jgi:hypothetical protein
MPRPAHPTEREEGWNGLSSDISFLIAVGAVGHAVQ